MLTSRTTTLSAAKTTLRARVNNPTHPHQRQTSSIGEAGTPSPSMNPSSTGSAHRNRTKFVPTAMAGRSRAGRRACAPDRGCRAASSPTSRATRHPGPRPQSEVQEQRSAARPAGTWFEQKCSTATVARTHHRPQDADRRALVADADIAAEQHHTVSNGCSMPERPSKLRHDGASAFLARQ